MKLNYPTPDGMTLRQQLTQVEKTTGKRNPFLDSLVVPEDGSYVWNTFWSINRNSITEVSYSDMYHYSLLYGVEFTTWELDTMILMSSAIQSFVNNEEQKREKARKSSK